MFSMNEAEPIQQLLSLIKEPIVGLGLLLSDVMCVSLSEKNTMTMWSVKYQILLEHTAQISD